MTEKIYGAPSPVDKSEAMRYLGVKKCDEALDKLLDECAALLEKNLDLKCCFTVLDTDICGNQIDFKAFKTESASLAKHLEGCKKCVLFACTIGTGADRLIQKYSRVSPSKAAAFQALGSAAVEGWCDEICRQIESRFGATTQRFSCGYGDLPLALQRDIFTTLEVTKNIGIALSDNLFMTPSKSVTAFVGIKA